MESKRSILKDKTLEEQVKYIISIEDEKYNDNLLTPELRRYILALEKEYVTTLKDYKMHLAPSYREVKGNHFNISGVVGKSYYATSYPSYIDFLWTRDMLTHYAKRDMSWFIYPSENSAIQAVLRRRSTQLKAEISTSIQK